jgi:hypothetical protein
LLGLIIRVFIGLIEDWKSLIRPFLEFLIFFIIMISSNCISAEVVSYSLSTEGWLKEIKYVIKVVDTSGESEILRGSKDFKVLQKILITRWPGCKIPVIPSDFSQVNPP